MNVGHIAGRLGLLFSLALSLSLSAYAASPPLAKGPPAFLTKGVESVVTNLTDNSRQERVRPTKDGTEAPFYDEPFALHVPFEVRLDGGPATVTWSASLVWDTSPTGGGEQPNLYAGHYGFYRADGRQPAVGSIRSGSGGAFQWEPNLPLPTISSLVTSADGKRTSRAESVKVAGEIGPHKPFADSGNSIQLNPAEPGTHILWLGFDSRGMWPKKEPMRTTLHGTFYVDIVVARGDRGVSSDEIAYLFKNGKRSANMLDDKFFWTTTVALPFTLRRDGWEFDHIEATLRDQQRERIQKKRESYQQSWARTYDAPAPAVNGRVVSVRVGEKSFTGRLPDGNELDDSGWDTVWEYVNEWKITFPQTFPDWSWAELTVSGNRAKKLIRKPNYQPSDPGPTYSWFVPLPAGLGNEQSRGGRAFVWWGVTPSTVDAPDAAGLAEYRTRFLRDYGPDSAEWFKPVWYPKDQPLPKAGEVYHCYAWNEEVPKKYPAGPVAIASYEAGPWNIVAYYKRLREVDERVVASKAVAGEPTVVKEVDEFWKWYVQLAGVLGEQIPKAMGAQIQAVQAGVPLPGLLQSRDRLLFVLQPDSGLPPWRGAQRVWNTKDKVWEWSDSILAPVNFGNLLPASKRGSVNTAVETSPEMKQRMQQKVAEIAGQIARHRAAISDYTKEATAAYEVILAKVDEGYQKYGGPEHPELTLWKKRYRDERDRAPLDIAQSISDVEFLRKAIEDSAIHGESASTRAAEAQLLLMTGDAIGAMKALRRGLSIETNNFLCVKILGDVECTFLQRAIDKSQGAIADARRHFYGYLMERGFTDTDIIVSSTNRLDWMATRIGVYGEEAWAAFTTGLFGSFSAFYGKPAAEADLLATTERQMTTAFVGLHTMRLLRKKGVTFAQMQQLTSRQIADTLGLYNPRDGSPLSDQDAANMGVAVREAMKLPDVQALMSGNDEALLAGQSQGYWDSADVSNTWIEWYGDLTSPFNLFTLGLPLAKAGTAGRTSSLMWTKAESAMISDLQQLGVVKSGTEQVAAAVGVTRAISAVGATERGKQIADALVRLERYQAGLGAMDQAIWTVGKISGALTFGVVSVGATEHLVGHKAAMLVQAAMMFAGDTPLLKTLLEARGIPPQRVAQVIISEYLPATQVHLKRLAAVERSAFELEELLARVKAGQKLSNPDFDMLNRYFGSDWRKLTPGAYASENAAIAINAAAESIRSGVDNGALKAATELNPAIKAEVKATQQTLREQKEVADALNAARTEPNPPRPSSPPSRPPVVEGTPTEQFHLPDAAPVEPVEIAGTPDPLNGAKTDPVTPGPPGGAPATPANAGTAGQPAGNKPTTPAGKPIARNGPVTGQPTPGAAAAKPKPRRAPGRNPEAPASSKRVLPEEARDPVGGYLINPPVRETSQTAQAMQALENGQYRLAEDRLIAIQEGIRNGTILEADEMVIERIHSLRMLANELQRAKRNVPAKALSIGEAIPAATVEEVLSTPGMLKPKVTSGAMSTVYDVEGHPDLFVKKIQHEFKRTVRVADPQVPGGFKEIVEDVEIDILEDVQNNLIHEQLARAMGFDVPVMEARIVYDANNRAVEAYYVMRKVKGTPLAEMTTADVFLYREELARHRALATLLGDFDRKLDNYIITAEGHFVPIDAGMADVTGSRMRRSLFEYENNMRKAVLENEKALAQATAENREALEKVLQENREQLEKAIKLNKEELVRDSPYTIDGVFGRDHWYAKAVGRTQGKELLSYSETTYRKLIIGEEALTFQGAEPTVKEIENFFFNGTKSKEASEAIREAYIRMHLPARVKRLAELKNINLGDPAARAALEQEAIASLQTKIDPLLEEVQTHLKARAPKIRDSMKGFNKRNGIPVYETEGGGAALPPRDDVIIPLPLEFFRQGWELRLAA